MSVLRVAQLAKRVRPSTLSVVRQRRWASSGDHHHEDTHDSTVYPKEGFTGPFWRNVLISAGVFTGLAVFSPSDMLRGASSDSEETPWLTRVIAHNAPSKETWQKVNERHLQQTEELARNAHLVQHAKQPTVHRFRYASGFDQVSPHRLPVGGTTDMSDLQVKNDVV